MTESTPYPRQRGTIVELYAPAKLNLYLDVIDKRADGYHNIVSIMQTIGLYDVIQFEAAEEISLKCPALDISSESNLAYKAARLLQKHTNSCQGASINIDKHIPVGAGLGGGSSDAASVLMGLNKLWELDLNKQELMQIGAKLGADVPFFIIGGTCLAEWIGTKITPLPNFCNIWFVLVYPKINISTDWVYKNVKFELTNQIKTVKIVTDGLKHNDIMAVSTGCYNRLENVTLKAYPQIPTIKNELKDAGCLAALMSGSGSCVFGITGSKEEAEKVVCKLKRDEWDMFIVSSGG
ncbi:4-(cytidine 5'-diphospho)-2-C-methyl-D-erythritol kinase [Candidatus Desantisbacteria bacterium CG_4_8_14_3_um_filter_40_12]|uniref:4-diphosphocytidyl-2-C-methyl-D-erythritol kinase n=3 Tax=unclassified Candidatus Desantisiibacteriota TaxID=3106372 RepID=A0A2M7JCH5_9BACT|nr:MAG: 4-(cytidine 5'-diphospho)-2-C-methyl-D-erythritol kinase [Candidatus Desantisbacteria bacterium CG23_combo_of_CG06-09_8_20_14_all_40_23]PIX17098.1 MAG: 4-(cytidine 5'-diphospho)-2-C-methyl-D-erythritol kinase [Candidatus Desantisbacteria bacterium CG_4_8_14_3_um_filter_40_12]PIY19306.1 MAG: 4-(cytidine 5'-diphospho)-2-C-methyl-D-erythritol kinase [Candidatus Desantisbacteria bacterium CG_4_10_14_3_um_filter_40_18]